MIGQHISPILTELESAIIDFNADVGIKPCYTPEAFRAGIMIFSSVLMDKIWELCKDEKMEMKDREAMAQKCWQDIRQLVKTYTGIDSHELYL